MKKYLPWIAGGALAGYLHRKGPRGLRDGEGIPPAQLDLSTITLGPWTAVPVPEQKEDRWGGTTRLWNVVGPQKGFSLWRYWPKAWGVNLGGDYRLFLKKGRSYVGYMLLDEVRHQGESAWVVTQSSLEKGYRGVGLGSLMYLASRNLLEAYQGGPVKFIPTEDYLGGTSGGTSPMAQKVWKRLSGEGRLNRDPGFLRDLKSANVFLMDWVCDGWGKLPAKIQRIADKEGALTAAEKRTLVEWFRATAPGNY